MSCSTEGFDLNSCMSLDVAWVGANRHGGFLNVGGVDGRWTRIGVSIPLLGLHEVRTEGMPARQVARISMISALVRSFACDNNRSKVASIRLAYVLRDRVRLGG